MMVTRRVALRELTDTDLPTVYRWRNTPSFRSYIMSYDDKVSFEEFCGQMRRSGLHRPHRFMVDHRVTGRPIGFTYARDHAGDGSSCFLNIYIEDAFVGLGYGVDIFALMTLFLLREVRAQSVYVDVFAYNTKSLAAMWGAGFREIEAHGETRDHDGAAYPIHRFEISEVNLPKIEATLTALSSSRSSDGRESPTDARSAVS